MPESTPHAGKRRYLLLGHAAQPANNQPPIRPKCAFCQRHPTNVCERSVPNGLSDSSHGQSSVPIQPLPTVARAYAAERPVTAKQNIKRSHCLTRTAVDRCPGRRSDRPHNVRQRATATTKARRNTRVAPNDTRNTHTCNLWTSVGGSAQAGGMRQPGRRLVPDGRLAVEELPTADPGDAVGKRPTLQKRHVWPCALHSSSRHPCGNGTSAASDAQRRCAACELKATQIPVKVDRQGHSCHSFKSFCMQRVHGGSWGSNNEFLAGDWRKGRASTTVARRGVADNRGIRQT